jgi:hypothetical protein
MRAALWNLRPLLLLVLSACAADSAMPVETETRRPPGPESYAVGTRPIAVAVADFNGDRATDIATANSGDGTVTVLLGATGGFRGGGTFSAGQEPADLKAADVDRDGDPDLVIANHETALFTVLLNDGKGGFSSQAGSPFETGARPHIHSVVAADFDGDGWIDVAVESADTQEVRLRRGSSRGFGPVVAIAVGTMPYVQLGAGDITGDAVADVLVPGHRNRTVRALTRSGSGFVLAPFIISTTGTPWGVTAGELNGDGERDLVVREDDAVTGWLKGADGYTAASWSPLRVPGATGVAAGNLDGDRIDDIVVGSWEGSDLTIISSRTPVPRKIEACSRPIGLAITDLDQNGAGDIVVACANEGRILVLRSP